MTGVDGDVCDAEEPCEAEAVRFYGGRWLCQKHCGRFHIYRTTASLDIPYDNESGWVSPERFAELLDLQQDNLLVEHCVNVLKDEFPQ